MMMQRTRQATPATVLAFPQATQALEPVATTYPLSDPTPPARARMRRYALMQLRDFFMKESAAMLLLAFALTIPMWTRDPSLAGTWLDQLPKTFPILAGGLIIIGTLLAIRGVVSDDTQHGFHRFLFSKPLDIGQYYAQSLIARFAAFMLTLLVLVLPFALVGQPIMMTMAIGALFFTLAGGVGFFLSTISRHNIGLLLATGAVASAVQGMQLTPGFGWLKPLALALPPLDQFNIVVMAIMGFPVQTSREFPLGQLLWVLAYGIAAVLAGLAVLRRRAIRA